MGKNQRVKKYTLIKTQLWLCGISQVQFEWYILMKELIKNNQVKQYQSKKNGDNQDKFYVAGRLS